MIKRMKVFSLGLGLIGVALMAPQFVGAKATGPCVNCHTMHNSQDGDTELYGATPNGALTTGGCIGCHTSPTTSLIVNNIPMVLTTGEPADVLAGGNFYWVNTTDSTGHNVVGLKAANQDVALALTPPGWNANFNANGQVTLGTWNQQLTCAGTYGCHGTHENTAGTVVDDFTAISGAHHADDSAIDGTTTAKSFRFLYGIIGKEDPTWENDAVIGNTLHNTYFGVSRLGTGGDAMPTSGDAIKSINYLCAECHGDFHSGADTAGADTGIDAGAAWLRHPTDIDMNALAAGVEYKSYTAYDPLVPVATNRTTGGVVTVDISNPFANSGDAIVNCISCHRAHGSIEPDLLRWDYDTCVSAGGDDTCGCFVCHTTKDDV
ncbi:MAG: cytochrome c3 family protein [Thermodesulfobacteriota bacterium]|jgi:hypothetical protein